MEPVGELDDDDPDIARHGYEHLADILRLLLLLGLERHPAYLGNAVDKLGTFGVLRADVTVKKGRVLFPRIDIKSEIAELERIMKPKTVIKEDDDLDKAGIISIDDFAKVKLRTGEITACEKIKKSKKLLKIQVDDARGGRQIVSGIAEYYTPEELIGKKIIFVANLAPAKLCGEESNGMLLACDAGDKVQVVFLDKDTPNGSTVR